MVYTSDDDSNSIQDDKIDNYYWSIIGEHIQIVLGEFSGGNVQSLGN